MFPVPTGVEVRRQNDRVLILAVLGEHFAVNVLRRFLTEAGVEPGLVKEYACNQPHPRCQTGKEHQSVEIRHEHKHRADNAHPTGVGNSAYAGAGSDDKPLSDGFDAYGVEFALHKVRKLFLTLGARQTGTYVVRRRCNYSVSLVGIRFEFLPHISSSPPSDGNKFASNATSSRNLTLLCQVYG